MGKKVLIILIVFNRIIENQKKMGKLAFQTILNIVIKICKYKVFYYLIINWYIFILFNNIINIYL